MVKASKISPEELLREDERLERMFRQKIMKTKNLQINDKQFRNRLVDFFELMARGTQRNGRLFGIFLKRFPGILNRLCLSSRFEYLNGHKILQVFLELLQKSSEELPKNLDGVDLLIKTIFNILIYKKIKHFVPELLKAITLLLSAKHAKIEKLVDKNLDVLTGFLDKGKDIDKVFFSFKKILTKSPLCFRNRFEELLFILSKTKNSFYIEHFTKFLLEVFQARLHKERQNAAGAVQKNGQDKELGHFFAVIEKHARAIYNNLGAKDPASKEQKKRSSKVKKNLAKLLESVLGHYNAKPGSAVAKVLENLNADMLKAEEENAKIKEANNANDDQAGDEQNPEDEEGLEEEGDDDEEEDEAEDDDDEEDEDENA